jgi:hypothetical protein
MLKTDKLVGGIVYYDGQHNDARMNIALAFTAARMGANIANHCEVMEIIHENMKITNAQGQPEDKKVIRGVKCFDRYQSMKIQLCFSKLIKYIFQIKHLQFEQNVLLMQQDHIQILFDN